MKSAASTQASIYAIFDSTPGTFPVRYYIGKAMHPGIRFRAHMNASLNGNDPTYKARWIRVLAAEGKRPSYQILEECTVANYSERERYWIAHFRRMPGYRVLNQTDGGDGGRVDAEAAARHRSAIIRSFEGGARSKKMSEAGKALWQNSEYRAHMKRVHTGYRPSPEAVEKRAAKARGKPWSERKRKAIMASMDKWRRGVTNLTTGIAYKNTTVASAATGTPIAAITGSILKNGNARGHKWTWTT